MRKFHHVGLPTDDQQADETWVPETKVWVTDPSAHPYRVEYLRYEPDSPVTGPLRQLPHLAFETDDLSAELAGQEVLMEPFEAMPEMFVAFILQDGAVFEYMHWVNPEEAGSWTSETR